MPCHALIFRSQGVEVPRLCDDERTCDPKSRPPKHQGFADAQSGTKSTPDWPGTGEPGKAEARTCELSTDRISYPGMQANRAR